MNRQLIIKLIKIAVWIAGLYLSTYFRFHTLYFVGSGFIFIFANLGKRQKGTLSAYSVFNENFERLPGTMDGLSLFKGGQQQQKKDFIIEKSRSQTDEKHQDRQQYFKNESKYGNKPCFCGSSIKFKKCCLVVERKRLEQQRIKRIKGQ